MIRDEVYCYIMTNIELYGKKKFTQKEISTRLGVSIGSVYNSLEPLEKEGIIEKFSKGFIVKDPIKLLHLWGIIHEQKVEYSTFYPSLPEKIENMITTGLFTSFSGAKIYYNIKPLKYSEVYVYTDCNRIKEILPFENNEPNIFCLKTPKCLKIMNINKTPLSLIYVDTFKKLSYSTYDFLKEIEEKLTEILNE